MPWPTFVIAGTVRGATTSLHYYLDQHPQIAMSSIKEPNFFLFDKTGAPTLADKGIITKSVRSPLKYQELFDASRGVTARGDASPLYLYTPESPRLIAERVPDAAVIAVLRDPVKRAWSHFLHLYRGDASAAPARFADAITPELAKPDLYEPYTGGTHFLRIGRYAEQVARYQTTFGRDRFLAVDYDDVQRDASAVLAAIAEHVGVDAGFVFDTETVYNASGVVRSNLIGRARTVLSRAQPHLKRLLPRTIAGRLGRARARLEHHTLGKPAPLDDALVGKLRDWYAADVARLEGLIGRDLSHWDGPV